MLQLRPLRTEDEQSFKDALLEFEKESPPWQFAFDYDANEAFGDYVARVNTWTQGIGIKSGWVPNSFLVGVVDGKIVGRVSLRHRLNAFLREYGGHIGYGVVPSERRKGYASEMLHQALVRAKELGIGRAMVTCDSDNIGSRKTIENNGGCFEKETHPERTKKPLRIYWIEHSI